MLICKYLGYELIKQYHQQEDGDDVVVIDWREEKEEERSFDQVKSKGFFIALWHCNTNMFCAELIMLNK